MPRLIDADELYVDVRCGENEEPYISLHQINDAPTVDAEPTEEQVKEYCHKRCLVIVTSELFNEMKARWSAEPVVRCKDCIYYHKGNWYDDDVCKVHSNNDRGYCAWGERK